MKLKLTMWLVMVGMVSLGSPAQLFAADPTGNASETENMAITAEQAETPTGAEEMVQHQQTLISQEPVWSNWGNTTQTRERIDNADGSYVLTWVTIETVDFEMNGETESLILSRTEQSVYYSSDGSLEEGVRSDTVYEYDYYGRPVAERSVTVSQKVGEEPIYTYSD